MKTNSFKSIKQKRYTKADLINASLRFDYKNHIVINADMKEVVCFKDKDVVESFYNYVVRSEEHTSELQSLG